MSSALERRLQDDLAARELTLDGVDGNAADLRELRVREPVDVVQCDQNARLVRHAGEGAREVDALREIRAPMLGRRLELSVRATPSQLVDAYVGQHAIEPRR